MTLTIEPFQQRFSVTTPLSIPWNVAGKMYPHEPFAKPIFRETIVVSQPRLIRPMYASRIDIKGRIILMYLAEAPGNGSPAVGFSIYDAEGILIRRFATNDPGVNLPAGSVTDYQPDHEGGVYLLDLVSTEGGKLAQRMSRIGADGILRWTRQGNMDHQKTDFSTMAGCFKQLCVPSSGRLYLPCSGPEIIVGQVNPENGEILCEYAWDDLTAQPVVDAAGKFYYGRYDVESNGKHSLIIRNPEAKTREIITPEVQQLCDLAGVDMGGNVYAKTRAGVSIVAPDGSTVGSIAPTGMILRKEGRSILLTTASTTHAGGVNLLEFDSMGNVINRDELGVEGVNLAALNFIHQDESGYYFYGKETDWGGGELVIVAQDCSCFKRALLTSESADGSISFADVNERILPIESKMAETTYWQTDGRGNIYATLSDSHGFHVVKFSTIVERNSKWGQVLHYSPPPC